MILTILYVFLKLIDRANVGLNKVRFLDMLEKNLTNQRSSSFMQELIAHLYPNFEGIKLFLRRKIKRIPI
jgi:hypothetical protein